MTASVARVREGIESAHPSTLFAWGLFVLCASMTLSGSALFLSSRSAGAGASFGSRDTAYVDAVIFLVMPLVGALIISKRDVNPLGWLFCGVGLCMSTWAFADSYALRALLVNPDLPAGRYAAWLAGLIWIPGWCLAGLVFLLFPTGRLLSPHWRWEVRLLVTTTALVTILYALTPGALRDYKSVDNPFGIDGIPLTSWQTGVVVVAALGSLGSPCVVALLLRMRRSHGIQRQQVKWLVWASALVLGTIGIWVVLAPLGVRERGLEAASTLAGAGIPLAAGVAVLRYRLWDIDIIINRTIVYGVVSAVLGGLYVASVVLLQRAFEPWTRGSDLAISASTLAVAGLFRPALRRIQAGVDFRFYRHRYDAQHTIDAFRARVQEQVDLDEVQAELLDVVHETMQPEFAGLWLRPQVTSKGD